LTEKLVGRAIPARFVAFCFVGGLGVLVHLCVLRFAMQVLKNPFTASQALATVVAMTSNYMFNNMLTYRDLRLRGWGLLRGWLSFILVCSIGALANVGIAGFLFKQEQAGWLVSALAGILVGTVWNYAVTSVYTWHKRANAEQPGLNSRSKRETTAAVRRGHALHRMLTRPNPPLPCGT
jgi:dolichol-phosphate mannosyltransferase